MKRGITAYVDYDCNNRWMLIIEKVKGKLTLAEIRETAREYCDDYYLLVIDALHEEDCDNDLFLGSQGDRVELYSVDALKK